MVVANFIPRVAFVLGAVQFHHEALFAAGKVGEIRSAIDERTLDHSGSGCEAPTKSGFQHRSQIAEALGPS